MSVIVLYVILSLLVLILLRLVYYIFRGHVKICPLLVFFLCSTCTIKKNSFNQEIGYDVINIYLKRSITTHNLSLKLLTLYRTRICLSVGLHFLLC